MLVGFYSGDRVWVTVEVRFGHGSWCRSSLRSSLGFSGLSLFNRVNFNSSGGQCGEWWCRGLNQLVLGSNWLGLRLNQLQAMGIFGSS